MSDNNERPLGDWLRHRREELGIDLNQAEVETRIRRRSLEALEAEDFDALPDSTVGRGFLRNYAAYLGLDPTEASIRYTRLVAPPQPESTYVEGDTPFNAGSFRPMPLHQMPGFVQRRAWWWVGAFILVLIVALASLAWWHYPRVSAFVAGLWPAGAPAAVNTSAPTRTSPSLATTAPAATFTTSPTEAAIVTEPPSSESPAVTSTRTPTWTPSPSPSPSPRVYTGIFLELEFTDTSWVQVTVDGVREFQGELETDTHRSWYGQERIELRIGNAGAVLVTINGQSLGTLGASGEVVDRIFEKAAEDVIDIIVETATATRTSTPLVEETDTPQPEAPGATEAPPSDTDTPSPTDTSPPPTDTPAPGQ